MSRLEPASTAFHGDYEAKAHMQQSTNEQKIEELVTQFTQQFPDKDKPLKCLDIGCGGGNSSFLFYERLKAKGYTNLHVTGVDISEEQIIQAKTNLESKEEDQDKFEFKVADAANLQGTIDEGSFDCVFSLFTFHWIDDKQKLCDSVAHTLKDNGLLFFLTVTAMPAFFSIRKELLQQLADEDEWKPYFSGFDILPFAEYQQSETAFKEKFSVISSTHTETMLEYTEDKFRTFLTSWLPEIRKLRLHKRDDLIDKYLDKLLGLIKSKQSNDINYDIESITYHFSQPLGLFNATKKMRVDDRQEFHPASPVHS